jgi:hypothetical protein
LKLNLQDRNGELIKSGFNRPTLKSVNSSPNSIIIKFIYRQSDDLRLMQKKRIERQKRRDGLGEQIEGNRSVEK